MLREKKIRFFARYLGSQVIFDNIIHGELRGVHMDGLLNLDVIEEWDNNTPIYKKWMIEDTKLCLNRDEVSFDNPEDEENINQWVIFKTKL